MHMNLLQLSPKGRHKHLDRLSIEHFWSWIEIQVHKYNGYMHCIIKNTSMLILACCVPFFFLSTQALLLGEINQLAAENTERKDSWTFAAGKVLKRRLHFSCCYFLHVTAISTALQVTIFSFHPSLHYVKSSRVYSTI